MQKIQRGNCVFREFPSLHLPSSLYTPPARLLSASHAMPIAKRARAISISSDEDFQEAPASSLSKKTKSNLDATSLSLAALTSLAPSSLSSLSHEDLIHCVKTLQAGLKASKAEVALLKSEKVGMEEKVEAAKGGNLTPEMEAEKVKVLTNLMIDEIKKQMKWTVSFSCT